MNKNTERKCYLKNIGFADVIPVCLGYHECPPSHVGPGMRPYHLVHYVVSGCGTLIKNGKSLPVRAGEMFVIRRLEDATYIADEKTPWSYTWIGFNGDFADRLFSLNESVVKCSAAPFDLIFTISDAESGREELAAAAVMMLLAEIFSDKEQKTDYVTDACHVIESMYMTDISVADIAARLGLDRRYLSRIFRQRMGMTVMDYIIKTRLNSAYRLLSDGLSVTRVSELVGYSDPFYFSKMFKRFYGIPPRAVPSK